MRPFRENVHRNLSAIMSHDVACDTSDHLHLLLYRTNFFKYALIHSTWLDGRWVLIAWSYFDFNCKLLYVCVYVCMCWCKTRAFMPNMTLRINSNNNNKVFILQNASQPTNQLTEPTNRPTEQTNMFPLDHNKCVTKYANERDQWWRHAKCVYLRWLPRPLCSLCELTKSYWNKYEIDFRQLTL